MLICKRFFGVLSCFFFLLLAPINNDSQAACGSDPNADSVKIAGYAYTSTSIQDAYNYASTTLNLPSFTLQLAGQIFTEDLLLDGGAVVLDGSYDCSFVTKTSPSSVFGTIIIRNGSLNVAAGTVSPKVVSTDQTTFDRDGDGFTSIGSTSGSADDCNDNVFAINPGAVEICDGLDNNCDGQTDEGLTGTDADGDGYYAEGSCAAIADDCNDNDAGINPGVLDIPYDGINQDCSQDGDLTFNNGDACVPCHSQDNLLDFAHSWRPTATDDTCVLCHAGPVNRILSGHYGKTVRTTDNNVAAGSTINCWTCHDNNNHSGGPIAGAFGDGLGDVWNDVAPPYPDSYTCDNCHANRSTRHATATAHNNRVIDSTCANCHTSPSSGTLASAADVDALHRVALPTDCALCHAYSGTLLDASVVRQTISQGLSGTQVSCLNCHTDKGTNHGNFTHPIEVGPADLSYNPGQLCSACHVVANWAEIEGTEHNVATNGAGSCATCHNSSRQIVQNVIADASNNGGYPIRCLACHADKNLTPHGDVDHVALGRVTGGTTFCLGCHDPGTAANATVDVTHNGTCSLCHTTVPNLQPGVPAGGGDCVTCHSPNASVTWEVIHLSNPPSHASLVQVPATGCADCHDNTLVSAAAETHNGCTSCHEADTGALVSLAIGQNFTDGGDCTTCHMDSWEVTHTTNMPDHGFLVRVDATSCAGCHSDPPPLVDAGDPKVHNGCDSCHNADGSLLTLYDTNLQSFVTGGDCMTCHTTGFDSIHAISHAHTVAQGALDLSYDPPGTPCSDCHVVSTWAEIEGTEHNVATNGAGSCSTCHNSSRQEVIDAITAGATTNCLACHSNKNLTVHGGIDHVASGDVTLATACADCHDDTVKAANWTVDVTHSANCTLCHTTVPTLQEGVPAGPANCATCHSAAWNVTHLSNTPDHSSLVTTTGTNCGNCHADSLVDTSTHLSNCSNCHTSDGSLVPTLGTDSKTFAAGGTCTSCHTGRDWTDHNIDHQTAGYVTLHSECTSCHAATLTAGADFINPADDEKHNACTSCHGANGAIATGSVDCSACHSGETTDWTTHAQDHTTLVTQQTECSSCHTATVEYANFVDPANNVKHDNCYVCHDNTTKLASAAAGDCSSCHTANYFDSHTHSHDVSYNPSTDTSQSTQQGCATCHDDNGGALASWTDIYVEHLGNCATCHSYTDDGFGTPLQPTVETTIASGTAVTCATCHTPKVPATDHGVDHIASSYVTGEAACLVCHIDPATTFTDPANAKIHDDCTTCHDSGTNALIGSAAGNEGGPNTCTSCHTGRDWTDHNIDHQTAGYVTLHSECTSCHATTLTAGADFINPADDEKHNACTSCHAADGAIATGSVDCSACHSGETTDWTTHAQDHTTLVTQQTECSSCHTATVEYANFVDPANNVKHDNCYVCHDNTTKLASAAAGDCSSCHTANYFDSHTHSHDVSYNPSTDTSQSTQQGCATCHDDNGGALASWTDIYVEHLGNCATCHSYTDDGFGTPLQPTVETTIASGTAVTCATCHTPKVPATDHGVDHIASSYVTGEAACLVCHIDPATTFTDPANAKIHDDCTTCHDSGTNALIGSAAGNEGGPNTCTSCHTGRDWTDHNIDHQTAGYVTLHSECTSCHAATLTAGADFINPADDEKHNACTSCHAADGAIATGSVDCSACHSGETTDWTTHAQDHTTLVTQQTECSSCHTATVEYANFVDPANNVKHDNCYVCHDNTTKLASAAAGDCSSCHTANYFDSHTHSHDVSYNPSTDTSQSTQQGCATCHDDNGGALASWTDIYVEHLGNCATCHSYTDDGFGTPLQPTVETTIASGTAVTCATCHTPKVPATDHGVDHIASSYVTGEAACLVCHIDPATTFTDPANAKIHDDCTTCHDSGTNALIGSAAGNEGGPNTCTSCHTGRDWTDHNIDHQTAGYVTLHSECTSCHAATLTAGADFINPADDEKHNACTSCHGANGAIATGSVDCSACHSGETTDWTTHAQDHTTLVTQQTECSSCHTATVEYANFVDPANNVKHDNCYVCHDNTTKLASAAAGDCTQCHTANYFDSHTHSHDVSYNPSTDTSQSTQQGCATCHDDNGGALASWTDISVEHLGNCATCHSYTDDGFGTPLQLTVETTIASGTAVTCATCHTPKVPATDHGVDHIASSYVTGEAACLVCHIDPATTFTDPANAKIHDDCTTCHDSGTNALIGSAAGNEGGPNTCTSCHTGRDWTDHNIDHQTAGYVTLHSECTSCHATTLTAGADFINPADDEKHNACTSCHAADGAIATGSVDCSACHSGETTDWTTHAQDHTTLVTQQTECSSCHTATVEYANFVDPANNVKHDNCYVCHDNTTKLASAAAGDCTQCHTANYFDSHTHSHDVSYNPSTDTSQSTQQGCATCHDDNGGALASWTDISVEHLGNCATCHSYTDDGFGTPLQLTVETTIASGTAVTCATCHTPKVPATDHGVDHIASSYVTGEAACLVCHIDPATTFTDPANAKIHDDCTTCHDSGTNALIGSAAGNEGGPNTCTSCHTGRDWTDHNIDHQTAGYVTLHSECTSCHATTLTAGADFINPADDEKHNACTSCHAADGAIATGSVDCSACHATVTGDWTNHAQDHTVLVTQATGCASCHSSTVDYAAFVDPANNVKHDDCYVCHDNTTKLASAAAGDCSQCHSGVTGDFATHTTQDHTTQVTSATGCSSCHSATVDYAAFVDPANNLKHDSCATCHNATTNAPVATAGDCSQCHAGVVGDFTTHTTQDHTTKVTLQTECSSCHTATVDYANFIDGANDKKHDSCTTCHNATTNAPVATAGDCSQCHTANYFDSHTHSHTVSVGSDQSNGQSCDNCHEVTNWALIEGTEHNVATNGAGSCATCHNSPTQTVIDVIAAGAATTCLDCHSDKTDAHGDIDHVAATYVTVGGTQDYYGTTCASCHDPGGAENATVDITHGGNCNLCHTTVPNLQTGVPAGGGSCIACHSTSEHTLWGRYMDTCSTSGCHASFDGGPGSNLHDVHNPTGGWPDRNSATSGLTYPYSSDPNMWIPNWPLNPNCATCHTTFDDDQSGAGCGACHTFPGKGDLHNFHSGKKAGQMDIDCSICHFQS